MEKLFSQEDSGLGFVHKLNNHLTSVIGYGELLLLNIIDPEAKEHLARIVQEAKQASQVSKELSNFLRNSGTKPT